jgi:membrane protein implicated in regulation of membrane protease activity
MLGVHLGDVPRELLLAFALVALFPTLVAFARSVLGRRRMRRRFERGAEGEREAARLLEGAGYVIEASQAAAEYAVDVDGALAEVAVRADFVVSRGGERFVAEVKTGRTAPRLETSATRRQLLEYQHAFDVGGVLLVDADARTVKRISFRPPAPQAGGAGGAAAVVLASVLALGVALGVASAVLATR